MEWISVKDKLPSDSGRYLVVMSSESRDPIQCANYSASAQVWSGDLDFFGLDITHWMPLPEPPEGA